MVSSDLLQDGSSNCKSICRELSPNSEDESPATVKFIKMSCKYFTDGMVNRWPDLRLYCRFIVDRSDPVWRCREWWEACL